VKHWYQPRYRLTIDGAEWTTNGQVAYRERAPARVEELTRGLGVDVAEVLGAPVVAFGDEGQGCYVASDGVHAQAHFVRRARALFGERIEWHHAGAIGPFVASVDGAPVALVMPLRSLDPSAPKCVECGGSKTRECPDCDGCGDVEHECSCGHDCRHRCDRCGSSGRSGGCHDCDGTGLGSEVEPAFEVEP